MSNPVWPASLPQRVDRQGYRELPPETTIRTEMDAGPAKVRRRFTAGVRDFRVQLRLDGSQTTTLDDFYLQSCAGGAQPFDWVHPRTQAAATFRFAAPPVYSYLGGDYWQARLDLELLP